ncbi:hypothetical protein JB92DRAFT_2940503 [Gautieria morchelliformis]|nr:hypothetical protein JB92DRAFT_2940503 [Gautieria morchelliformis]
MMTNRPLPPTPYRGPIISTAPPRPAAPPLPPTLSAYNISPGSSAALKRRPHTRRLQSAPSSDLPTVSEENEADLAEDDKPQALTKARKRPRPTPLVPSRSYSSSRLPLVLQIPDSPVSFQEETPVSNDHESFALSPSTLFERRRSETILEFPVPPPLSHSLSTPATPPRHSPTPSHVSISSTSTDSSASFPVTPDHSDNDDDDALPGRSTKETDCFVITEDLEQVFDARSPRPPRRSASVVSLRSFNTAEFDAQAEPIYALMHPRREPVVPAIEMRSAQPVVENAQRPGKEFSQVPTQDEARSPRLMLSVLDTTHGGSFDVPLMLGSFLSPPSSPCSPNSSDSESDGEGIPISWSDSEADDESFDAALTSSEDETSDDEFPSRGLDPMFRVGANRRRTSRHGNRSQRLPPLQRLEPLSLDRGSPDSHSSVASPAKWNCKNRQLPRESLVPADVSSSRISSASSSSYRPPSPFPELRSRFSTSTLASIPEPPTSSSSKNAFLALLTGRTKHSSSKGEPAPISISPTEDRPSLASNPARGSSRRRAPIAALPMPSAFSLSTQSNSSRSSFYGADSCSFLPDESSGSTGLRRPPIPIELFLRG